MTHNWQIHEHVNTNYAVYTFMYVCTNTENVHTFPIHLPLVMHNKIIENEVFEMKMK